MPVVVDEIVISVEVDNRTAGGATSPASAEEEKKTLIAECVEQVLDILENRKER